MSRDLTSAVVLVTGGSRGIGRAAVHAFSRLGATVYACATSEERLREVVASAPRPGEVRAVVCDVTLPASVEAMMRQVVREAGGLDVLINNAGVLGPRAPIAEVSFDDWRRTLAVNLDGLFLVSKAALELLNDDAVIINLSSGVGRQGRAEWGPYAVSKHGVEGFTDTLAEELAGRAVVISLNPGGTATDMRAEAFPQEDPETLPTPEAVAETILKLAREVGPAEAGRKYDSRELFEG